MKASEALRLGSTIIAPARNDIGIPGKPGCALGMIAEAVGKRRVTLCAVWDDFGFEILNTSHVPCPCSCKVHKITGTRTVAFWIAHLFDEHVTMDTLPDEPHYDPWTLEQLTQWLETVEDEMIGNKALAQEQTKEALCPELVQR